MTLHCIPAEEAARLSHSGEIHVWAVAVADWLPFLTTLGETLHALERERAARFRFERDRRRFTLCRGLLRTLLGDYLSLEASEIELQAGPHDKPELVSPAAPRLEFNLSHSDQAALFAFAAGRRVGVDVERIHSPMDVSGLAQQVFTAAEIEKLSATPEQGKGDLFFTVWTQKEAFIKAVGLGLSAPVREITVGEGLIPASDGSGIGLIHGYEARWSLLSLPAPDGYKAALAVEGPLSRDLLRVRPLLPPQSRHSHSEPQA
jgi:4'-phosphopantetheinyl transferase